MNPTRWLQTVRSGRIFREGTSIAIGQFLGLLARLVGLRLITALVPPEVYGDMVLLVGVELLVFGVCCAPLQQAALTFYPDAARAERIPALRKLIVSMLRRAQLAAIVLLLGGGAVWVVWFHPGTPFLLFPVLCILLLAETRRAVEINLLNAARRQRSFSLWVSADAWARPLAAVACILVIGPTAASILIGYACGTLLVNLALCRLIRRPGMDAPDPAADQPWQARVRRQILRFSLPMVPEPALGWFANVGDRYILAGFSGAAETGIYAAAYGIASQPFILLASVVGVTLRPVLFDAVSARDTRKVARTLFVWVTALLACSAVGLALVWLLSDQIVQLVLGKAFWRAAPLLIWIGLAYVAQGLQQAFANMIFARRRTEFLIVVRVVTALCAAVLYFLWIPRYGAMGAALGTLGANGAALVVTILLSGVGRWRKEADPLRS